MSSTVPPGNPNLESEGRKVLAVPELPKITARQAEVLELVALGMTDREIADCLEISPWTVKRHVANMLRRLARRRRIELAVWHARASRSEPG